MQRPITKALAILSVLAICQQIPTAVAAQPASTLVPNTTKGFISIPDPDDLRAKWDETQIGQLIDDPVMKPFVDDLKKQFKDRLSQTGVRLGVSWEDLDGIYGGEISVAIIQPGNNRKKHAIALLVDVTGHLDKANELLEKISQNLRAKKATKSTETVEGVELTTFAIPPGKLNRRPLTAIYFIKNHRLVAVDNVDIAKQILTNFSSDTADSLAELPEFTNVIGRSSKEAGGVATHIQWFIEPFGFAQVMRASAPTKRRQTDMLKLLASQGFDAVLAMGGQVSFSTGQHEMLHHTFIYAPAVQKDAAGSGQKYTKAANMLNFPATSNLTPQSWVPQDLATYASFSWKIGEAFEASKFIFNAMMKGEVFEETLAGLKDDPTGPLLDIRGGIIANLGERVSFMSDYQLPITPQSERLLVAIEAKRPQELAEAVKNWMAREPGANRIPVGEHVIWELVEENDFEVAELEINTPDADNPLDDFGDDTEGDENVDKPLFPNNAMCVAHGHFILASNVDMITKVLDQAKDSKSLAESADFKLLSAELDKLGTVKSSFRFFSRTDEEYKSTYELIRQGKMPESETLVGKLLNKLLGTGEDGVPRDQKIDGKLLPDYQVVRRYLGPAGLHVQTEENGWLLVGITLNKDAQSAADGEGTESPADDFASLDGNAADDAGPRLKVAREVKASEQELSDY